ncbi:MAG: radical SAM protein [Clostridia bacterium]|nr:radical SAM protein [Clostridia bacterium]
MNVYLKNLNKIEFVVTYACTGRCKHCSEGDHSLRGERIDGEVAAGAVRKITAEYGIETVMTFGGEPLLYPDAVCAIHSAAREVGVPRRQLITNGYFSGDPTRISEVSEKLCLCGVNDILLSVDAFHQEAIPLGPVKLFAKEAVKRNIPLRLQPAWLVSPTDSNLYNEKTREVLREFDGMDLTVGEGNIVFPEGNAKKYLAGYFVADIPKNPYREDPRDLRCISFDPSGDVLGGNLYRSDIMNIIREYRP